MKKLFYAFMILFFVSGMVSAGVVTVTSPGANSEWCINKPANPLIITWNEAPKDNQLVKIRLYTTSLVKVFDIINETDNDGSYNWTIPSSIAPGQYILRVRSLNNQASGDSAVFTIKNCTIEPLIPVRDLNVQHIKIFSPDLKVIIIPMPANPEIYKNTFARFKVTNVGDGSSKETKLRAFKSKMFSFPPGEKWPNFKKKYIVDSWDVHSLKPGRSFSRDIKLNPQHAKPIYWEADVDHENSIGDTNRINNRTRLKMKVKGPDLKITSINSPDYKKTIQQRCTMNVTVKNVGQVDAGRFEIDCDWKTCPLIAQGRKYKVCGNGLKSGESITFQFKHKYACFGMKYPTLHVDKANDVREQSESNNKCGFVFHLSGENVSGSDVPRTHNCVNN